MENMMALRDLTPTDGPIGMKPVSVENFDVAEEFYSLLLGCGEAVWEV